MERLFKLKGASVDHEDLVDLFPAGSATVKKIDQEYYLQSPESDSSQDDTVESVGAACRKFFAERGMIIRWTGYSTKQVRK
jgi:hypothetical protein